MTALKVFFGLITVFISLPLHFYGSWLVYNHIQATELMWFIWWVCFPITILTSVINVIVDKVIDKKGKE